MLCGRCYKKIPEGWEVKKSVAVLRWNKGGIYCKKCAVKIDKQVRIFWKTFLFFWLVISLLGVVIGIAWGKTTNRIPKWRRFWRPRW